MILKTLSLFNYRGYEKQNIVFSKGVNLLIGNNGSGKTNLLEAIYFLSLAKSYKTEDQHLIKFNQDFSRIKSTAFINNSEFKVKIIISKTKKKIIFNDQEITKLSDYIGKINVISFLPEDMNLIKGPPKNRRYFINSIIGQIDKNYLLELLDYKNLLKQRNELIKKLSEEKKPDLTLLDIYTEQVAKSGTEIINYRKKIINDINKELNTIYPFLANNNKKFSFNYEPSIADNLEKTLKTNYHKDLFIKTTTSGPHRDDYSFYLDKLDSKLVASQGEQRIMILALLLAISNLVEKIKNTQPIMLLDDVFSELDSLRQNKLINYLNKSNLQTIITTTTTANINQSILDAAKIYHVKNHFIRGKNHE
ncbi:MAG: DNA replication/repair protein RecF [Bacillota bacterium]